MFMVFYNVIVEGMKYATNLDATHRARGYDKPTFKSTYMMCAGWYVSKASISVIPHVDQLRRTIFIWMLYPVAWGLCEGGNVISPDAEAVFYGVLDFCAKPIFSLMLLWGHRNIDPVSIG